MTEVDIYVFEAHLTIYPQISINDIINIWCLYSVENLLPCNSYPKVCEFVISP